MNKVRYWLGSPRGALVYFGCAYAIAALAYYLVGVFG